MENLQYCHSRWRRFAGTLSFQQRKRRRKNTHSQDCANQDRPVPYAGQYAQTSQHQDEKPCFGTYPSSVSLFVLLPGNELERHGAAVQVKLPPHGGNGWKHKRIQRGDDDGIPPLKDQRWIPNPDYSHNIQRELDWFAQNTVLFEDYALPIISVEVPSERLDMYIAKIRQRFNASLKKIAKQLKFPESQQNITIVRRDHQALPGQIQHYQDGRRNGYWPFVNRCLSDKHTSCNLD